MMTDGYMNLEKCMNDTKQVANMIRTMQKDERNGSEKQANRKDGRRAALKKKSVCIRSYQC